MSIDPTDPVARFAEIRRSLQARWPESRISPTLERMRTLTRLLGDPQRAYPVIHVTGTNGKTSTARMIESLLRSFGLHTGLITSPHLSDLRERIRLDGEPIGLEAFLTVHDEVAGVLAMADEASLREGGPPLSFFEVMTALGFAAFADAPVDVAVVEVGMGGTWDATNVADADVAVITAVGMDHSDYLGSTLAEIAAEKAGIVKPGCALVISAQQAEAFETLLVRAVQMEARTVAEGVHFGVIERALAVGGQVVSLRGVGADYDGVFLPLFGAHQASNAACALAAVEAFFGVSAEPEPFAGALGGVASGTSTGPGSGLGTDAGPPGAAGAGSPPGAAGDVPLAAGRRRLDPEVVRSGFAGVTSPGRLEVVRRSPTVVVDAAHNVPGAHALAAALADSFSFTSTVGVVGILADKDAAGILAALDPVVDRVVVTRSTSPRAVPVEELARVAAEVLGEDRVESVARLDHALDRAIELAELASPAGVGGGVLVTGSITIVGEARLLLGAESGNDSGATRPDHSGPRGRAPQED